MLEKWKISSKQVGVLVILCYIGTSTVIIPGTVASEAGQDGWIAATLGLIAGLPIAWLYNVVGSYFPNMTIVEYLEYAFGKWVGKIVSILFFFYLFLVTATQIWIVGDFIVTLLMPDTPVIVINMIFIIATIYGARLGIEVIARAAEIVFPVVIIALLIFMLPSLKDVDIRNIQPVFENQLRPIIMSAIYFMGSSSLTLIVLLMVFPSQVRSITKSKKALLIGSLIGGIFLALTIVLSILVLGADLAGRNTYPTYVLAKKIEIGEFIQRIEVIMAMIWFLGVFFKIVIFFYGSVLSLSQVLGLRDYRPITLPLAMLLVPLSRIIYPDILYAIEWDNTTWIPFTLTFSVVLPLILLAIGKLRKKGRE